MIIAKCNHCGTEQPRTPQNPTAPPGWYTLSRIGGDIPKIETTPDVTTTPAIVPMATPTKPARIDWKTDVHLCSPACMIGFAQAEVRELANVGEYAEYLAGNRPDPRD